MKLLIHKRGIFMKNIEKYRDMLIAFRRHFHQFPELSYQEFETQKYIINKLNEFGITNVKKMFNTGVVALIGDEKKDCIAIRCDIDALPIDEKTNLPFKSQNSGVMHACAHDGHTAVVLTLAKILKENEEKLKNCVKLIFQPGEETDGGAKQMIEERVLEDPKVKNVFGFHFWNGIKCGKIAFTKGVSFASASRFEIRIKGKGGHGAMPENVVNSLYPTAYLIEEFKKINEKYKNAVVSLCACKTDGIHNIFCENVLLMGTIRTISETDYENIKKDIYALEKTVTEKYGCEIKTDIIYEYPCLENDNEVLNRLIFASKKALGEENIYEIPHTFATEDFSYFTKYCKSAHIKIGIENENNKNTMLPLHNPSFDIDENALFYALEIFYELIFA